MNGTEPSLSGTTASKPQPGLCAPSCLRSRRWAKDGSVEPRLQRACCRIRVDARRPHLLNDRALSGNDPTHGVDRSEPANDEHAIVRTQQAIDSRTPLARARHLRVAVKALKAGVYATYPKGVRADVLLLAEPFADTGGGPAHRLGSERPCGSGKVRPGPQVRQVSRQGYPCPTALPVAVSATHRGGCPTKISRICQPFLQGPLLSPRARPRSVLRLTDVIVTVAQSTSIV